MRTNGLLPTAALQGASLGPATPLPVEAAVQPAWPYRRALRLLAAAFLALAILFIAVPQIDLGVSALFFHAGSFWLAGDEMRLFLPKGLRLVAWALVGLLILGALVTLLRGRPVGRLGLREFLFLILCFALAPGVIVNGLLKEHWGRARPEAVMQFGGAAHYSPPLVISNQCESNCSFASGDASFAMTFLALAVLWPARRWPVVATVAATAVVGAVRIMQGAHFLSDVVLGAILMAATVLLLHQLILGRDPGRRPRA